jgi:hypothetical protein
VSDLFSQLKARVDVNARRAVGVYISELAEYRAVWTSEAELAELMDFAVLLRRRTAELSAADQPFSAADLEIMTSVGRERGHKGLSLAAQQSVLVVHSTLTLREVQEAAGPKDNDKLMRMLGWLSQQGTIAGRAFTHGFLDGQKHVVPAIMRVQLLADMLLADDSAAPEVARGLGLPMADRYVVTVVRVAGEPIPSTGGTRQDIIEILLKSHQAPVTWHRPEEFVALVPAASNGTGSNGTGSTGSSGNNGGNAGNPSTEAADAATERALALARDFAEIVARPCAVGTATGAVSALAAAVALARQVSAAAPIEAVPSRAHDVADVFVELGTAGLPHVDQWLRDVAGRLSGGPALVTTLDAYYRSDMNRLLTAAALHIHPRTLDYRLRRVRELTGIEPGSTHGVRVLSTAVARMLAGAWPDLA